MSHLQDNLPYLRTRLNLIVGLLLCAITSAMAFALLLPAAIFLGIYSRFRPYDPKKIFIGICEISGNIESISQVLSKNGYACRCTLRINPLYPSPNLPPDSRIISHELNSVIFLLILPLFFVVEFFRSNTFLYIWNQTFLWGGLDCLLLKIAGKKIIFMHCGDDVRYRPFQHHLDKAFGIELWKDEKHKVFTFLRTIYFQFISEFFGDVISLRDQATFQKKGAYFFRFPQKRNLSVPKDAKTRPLILHCPSDINLKGTKYVLEAIEKLKADGTDFDFELIHGKPNSYVLSRLKEADILIDQPGTWVARLAAEAMSFGCCVVGGNKANYYGRYDSPVIQFLADSASLHGELKILTESPSLRDRKMKECFSFWEKNYSEEGYVTFFDNLMAGEGIKFYPVNGQNEIILSAAKTPIEKIITKLYYSI